MSIHIKCEFEELERLIDNVADAHRKVGMFDERAKQAESWENEVRHLKNELANKSKPEPIPVSVASLRELLNACKTGSKLVAVKVLREITGLSLKEAKDLSEFFFPIPVD